MAANSLKVDKRNIEDMFGLTAMQEGMLYHYLSHPESKQYVEQIRLRLKSKSKLDIESFKKAWQVVTQTNEILRSVIKWEKLDEPVQIVSKHKELSIRVLDLSGEIQEKLPVLPGKIIQDDINEKIDITRDPLRITLCILNNYQSEMILTFHHILFDGWSNGIVLTEFFEGYDRLAGSEKPVEKPITIHKTSQKTDHKTKYREFFKWYRQQDRQKQKEFWDSYIQGFATRTLLPYDHGKLEASGKIKTAEVKVTQSLADQINSCLQTYKSHHLTVSILIYTAWGLLLQKYNNSDDIIFGTTVSGRAAKVNGIDRIVGLFMNTLPLRLQAVKDNTVLEVFYSVSSHVQERTDFEHSSLAEIQKFGSPGSDGDLFDSLVIIDNYPLSLAGNLSGKGSIDIDSYEMFEMTGFDLTWQVMLFDKMNILLHYDENLFEAKTIERLTGHFINILRGIVDHPAEKVYEIGMLSEGEMQQILFEFNHTPVEYPNDKTIHQLFLQQAAGVPLKIAVQFQDRCITYEELAVRSDELERRLRKYGVAAGSKVALMFPRCMEMIIGVLGILRANAGCIPLDISYPQERIGFIIEDSQAKFILKHSSVEYSHTSTVGAGTSEITEIDYNNVYKVEKNLSGKCKAAETGGPDQPGPLSYMVYTSGSTGKPKAALLDHSGIINHAYTKIDVLEITGQDIVANNFSINFIASIWQVVAPLLIGAKVVVYTEEVERDPYLQFERAAVDVVTILEVVPSIMKAYLYLLDEGKEKINLACVRKIALTGEESKPSLVNRFYKTYQIPLVNCYGQTECSDDVLHYVIPFETDKELERVPIGKPAHNTNILILNHHGQLQPIGIVGEICVIGPGVANGYWQRPELTAEKFIQNRTNESFPIENFCGGSRGAVFLKRAPLAAGGRMYRTGDLGRWLPDGNVEYSGRVDHQVKIRGNRVELREIENRLLTHEAIKDAAVIAREDREGETNLYAFFVLVEGGRTTTVEIRQHLLKTLPEYMVPVHFERLEKLPLTPNGKIDRKVLVKAELTGRIATGIEYQPPRNEIEKKIRDIWAQLLNKSNQTASIGIDDNFFDLGGHSLLLIKLKSKLEKVFDCEIGIIELFNHPTISHQAKHITGSFCVGSRGAVFPKRGWHPQPGKDGTEEVDKSSGIIPPFVFPPDYLKLLEKSPPLAAGGNDIAVIGISLRIPGASDIEEFWNNLARGIESISFFREEELEESRVNRMIRGKSKPVAAGGILGETGMFAADFFGYNPREAEIMDPQQRLFLEHAWMALEDAGYVGDNYEGLIGVYAGTGVNKYLLNNVMANPGVVNSLGEFQANIGNDKDFLATRISYKLNLRGPALTVQTACSTSLVAIHLAKQALIDGECHMALAGGVAVSVPEKSGYVYNEGGYLSPDGHCRAFDAEAKGTVFSNGIGIVVLKRLDQALADGDHIYAMIKGSAINNDGSLRVGYTSPGELGQASVTAQALNDAGINPETIGCVETHGTGTVLGDPVEIAALTRAYREAAGGREIKTQYCAIGSVKSNIGHLDAAAGVVGFIKTVLCLKNRQIPPSINIKSPNPMIDFANTPFYVNKVLAEWPEKDGIPRRAGVSAFGIGGTNAHVILEETPPPAADLFSPVNEKTEQDRDYELILLSARTETALREATRNLATHMNHHPEISLADVAYTLTSGRKAFDHRLGVACRDRSDAVQVLDNFDAKRIIRHTRVPGEKSVVFMFSGIGEHYVNMAYRLYQQEPVFKEHLDCCCDILEPLLKRDLRDILFAKTPGETDRTTDGDSGENIDLRKLVNREQSPLSKEEEVLNQAIYSQPSVFVVEYALARLLMDWGIKPYAMIGYSIGEYTAACLSGVFSLEDALFIVARRAQLIHKIERGAMLAISLPETEIIPLLPAGVAVAAVNTPDLCIVSGKYDGIRQLEGQLKKRQAVFRRLKTFQAFHSPMMAEVKSGLTNVFKRVTFHPPTIPFMSNLTGTWAEAGEVTTPGYWITHTVSPIRFSEGIVRLLKTPCHFFLEIGPGNSLCGFAAQHGYSRNETAGDRFMAASLPKESEKVPDTAFLLRTLSKLWAAGVKIDWHSYYKSRHSHGRRIPLPTYPFERKSYWLAAASSTAPDLQLPSTMDSIVKKQNMADWFYLPVWKQSLLPLLENEAVKEEIEETEEIEEKENWLFFLDESDFGLRVIDELKRNKKDKIIDVTIVRIGQQLEKHAGEGKSAGSEYLINPGEYSDYEALVEDLHGKGRGIDKIVHLWQWNSTTDNADNAVDNSLYPDSAGFLERGVYSLLYLVKALGKLSLFNRMELWVVSTGLHRIETNDRGDPAKAVILGPCKVIAQEFPNIVCRSIDFGEGAPGEIDKQRNVEHLVTELISSPADRMIAIRGRNRWVQSFEPVKLEKVRQVPGVLREKGVYVITGGLGKIGLTIARYLAQTVQARLVLTGRRGLPEQEKEKSGEENTKVKEISQLEELGAEVLVMQAEVADMGQMRHVVKETEEKFGPIHGVVHAAGVTDETAFKLIPDSTGSDCQRHFKPKIVGLNVLAEVFREKELDFCILTSSLSPILGGLGLYAYSAANSYMDSFAQQQALEYGKKWLSINWADWQRQKQEPALKNCAGLMLGSTVHHLHITPEEGKETFERILYLFSKRDFLPGLAVSGGDLLHRLQQWVLSSLSSGGDAITDQPRKDREGGNHIRPQLQSLYEPPDSEAEKIAVELWQELLGIEHIGVYDNFFELGGHSLIATKLISRIREIFRIDISLPVLFDGPTIRELVENIVRKWGNREIVEEIAMTYREVYSNQ